MDKKNTEIKSKDRILYANTVRVHNQNNTLNHVEDARPALKIARAGVDRLPNIKL